MRTIALVATTLLLQTGSVHAQVTSYIYRDARNSSHIRSSSSIEKIVRVAERWKGPVLWAEVDGREYLIRDPEVLASAAKVMEPLSRFDGPLHDAEETLRPLERAADRLEERVDELSDRLGDDDDLSATERDQLEAQLRDAEEQLRVVETKARDAEKVVEGIEKQADELEEIAEKELEKIILSAIRNGKTSRPD